MSRSFFDQDDYRDAEDYTGPKCIEHIKSMADLESWLAKLRKGAWYPLGIPTQQTGIEEPFYKTEDALRLTLELLRLSRKQSEVYMVVANPPFNILAHKESRHPGQRKTVLFQDAKREAHLIGLKDQAFYRAAQELVIEEASKRGEILKPIPVLLMSELAAHPKFETFFQAVQQLFTAPGNVQFREAVYQCVPKQLRPKGNEHCTYTQLQALDDKTPLNTAHSRVQYVFYQIAIVLMIGGEKLGHPGEVVYNEATQQARELLAGELHFDQLSFRTLPIPEAQGKVPYRAASTEDARRVPEALTGSFDINAFLTRHPLPPASDNVIETRRTALQPIVARAERHANLWQRMCGHLIDDLDCRADQGAILEPIFEHEFRDRLLQLTQEPFPLERFLLERSGIRSVLEGTKPVNHISKESPRWLPFLCPPPSSGIFSPGGLYIQNVAKGLLYRSDNETCPLPSALVFPGSVGRSTSQWTADFIRFRGGIFNPELEGISKGNPHIQQWAGLESLFKVIEGTRFERVYASWLVNLTGRSDVHTSSLNEFEEPIGLAEKVSQALKCPVFHSDFRAFFKDQGAEWRQ